jgi:hypothetical protein
MSDQDMEGAGRAVAGDPLLVGTVMFSVATGADVRTSVDSSEGEASVGLQVFVCVCVGVQGQQHPLA